LPLLADILPLLIALWIVVLFFPVAFAASESEYFMPLRLVAFGCCATGYRVAWRNAKGT
jgi:hypothetical protein